MLFLRRLLFHRYSHCFLLHYHWLLHRRLVHFLFLHSLLIFFFLFHRIRFRLHLKFCEGRALNLRSAIQARLKNVASAKKHRPLSSPDTIQNALQAMDVHYTCNEL